MSSPTEKRETMTSAEHCALAQRLNDATRDGRLVDGYRVLSELEPDDAELVALRAGFSSIGIRNRREFFKHLQKQLADAAQARLDGYSLNGWVQRPERRSFLHDGGQRGSEVPALRVPGPIR